MEAESLTGTITMGRRGTIVIPAEMRREMGIDCGSTLMVTLAGDELRLQLVPGEPLERLRWVFRRAFEGIDLDAFLAEEHADWPD